MSLLRYTNPCVTAALYQPLCHRCAIPTPVSPLRYTKPYVSLRCTNSCLIAGLYHSATALAQTWPSEQEIGCMPLLWAPGAVRLLAGTVAGSLVRLLQKEASRAFAAVEAVLNSHGVSAHFAPPCADCSNPCA